MFYNSTTGEWDTESIASTPRRFLDTAVTPTVSSASCCSRLISQQSVTAVHAAQQLACADNAGERRTSNRDPAGKRTVPSCTKLKRDTGATLDGDQYGNTLVNSPAAAGDMSRLPAQGNAGVRRASMSHGSSILDTLTHIEHTASSPPSRQITPKNPPSRQRTPSSSASSSKLRTCPLRTRSFFVDLHRNGERMYAKAGGGGDVTILGGSL
jgi:hypothetical protein